MLIVNMVGMPRLGIFTGHLSSYLYSGPKQEFLHIGAESNVETLFAPDSKQPVGNIFKEDSWSLAFEK